MTEIYILIGNHNYHPVLNVNLSVIVRNSDKKSYAPAVKAPLSNSGRRSADILKPQAWACPPPRMVTVIEGTLL